MPPLVEFSTRARVLTESGEDVIRVDQGAVDIPPPRAFSESLVSALGDPELHSYAPDPGLPTLRQALARYGQERFGVKWCADSEIMVTAGANQACFAALMALVAPGDEVLVPAPWYFNHAMTLTALGAVPVAIPTAETGFLPLPERVQAAIRGRTRGLVLVNPNNPTGVRYPDSLVRRLTELAVAAGLWVLADQTYQELCYDDDSRPLSPAAIAAAREQVITVGSFSKALGLAGWRLGFMAAPAAFLAEALKIQDCSVISACRAGQEGLRAALPEAARHVAALRVVLGRRRDQLMAELNRLGLDRYAEPAGSLFLFLALPEAVDDWAFCRQLLEEYHVVAIPGSVFGPGGAGHIRLSFGSTPSAGLIKAARRIAACCQRSLAAG